MKLALAAFALFAHLCAGAQQQLPPDPVDLQASYCFGLLNVGTPTGEMQAKVNKLRGFIMARASHIDLTGMIIASKQANLDMEAALTSLESCAKACTTQACAAKCVIPLEFGTKLARCQKLDFLPY